MLQKVPGMFEILISIYYWIFFYYKTFQNDVNIGESKNVNKMSDAKRLKLPVLNVRKKSKQILSNNLKLKRFSKKTQWVVYIQDFVFLFLFSFFIFLISFFPLSLVLFPCFCSSVFSLTTNAMLVIILTRTSVLNYFERIYWSHYISLAQIKMKENLSKDFSRTFIFTESLKPTFTYHWNVETSFFILGFSFTNSWKLLTIVAKCDILDFWFGSLSSNSS